MSEKIIVILNVISDGNNCSRRGKSCSFLSEEHKAYADDALESKYEKIYTCFLFGKLENIGDEIVRSEKCKSCSDEFVKYSSIQSMIEEEKINSFDY